MQIKKGSYDLITQAQLRNDLAAMQIAASGRVSAESAIGGEVKGMRYWFAFNKNNKQEGKGLDL